MSFLGFQEIKDPNSEGFQSKILDFLKTNEHSSKDLSTVPVSYTHLDVYKRQAVQFEFPASPSG